jgi:hypothetical protein
MNEIWRHYANITNQKTFQSIKLMELLKLVPKEYLFMLAQHLLELWSANLAVLQVLNLICLWRSNG